MLAAIPLAGVTGDSLRARAFFDANNVKVGDPMTLTVDFIGSADFASLHPPALSRHVDRRDWKVDDVSAKTDTYQEARRLTYRVRPMREGVIWFPALEFSYEAGDGTPRTVRSNQIPVHAKGGRQVVVAGMEEDASALPSPPALVTDFPGDAEADPDGAFAWRKACANPSAAAFAAFDFPEARLNEARLLLLEGKWSRALSVYRSVEWRIGQTPEVERGIVAALALKCQNPSVELPVWRQVLRPVLRFGWLGRIGVVTGALVLLGLVMWFVNRTVRALACLAVLLAASSAFGQGGSVFDQFDEMFQRVHEEMERSFAAPVRRMPQARPVKVTAALVASTNVAMVGSTFRFVVGLDAPRGVSLEDLSLLPSETFGLKQVGASENLTDIPSDTPSNVIRRIAVPVRYDVPFKGAVSIEVRGMVSQVVSSRNRRYQTSASFATRTNPVRLEVKALSKEGQPADYSGIISDGLRIHETVDLVTPETNDVVQITYRMYFQGRRPEEWMPEGAAFEIGSGRERDGSEVVEWRRFFVADGAPETPKASVCYYDPRTGEYRRAETQATKLKYVSAADPSPER